MTGGGESAGAGAAGFATPPTIVTVVLNTSRKDDTLQCLASLAAQTVRDINQVIVLDNGSVDGSIDAIGRSFPDVQIAPIHRDAGYAGNNNVGIRRALACRPEWIFILNEDTVLDRECLAQMLAAAKEDATIGIVGPLVLHHDEVDVIQSAGGQLTRYWESRHIAANQPHRAAIARVTEVDWVSGCALLVRRAVVEQVGMLDERFYYYWEETEWCVRAKKAGWRIVNAPAARLWHKGVRRDYRPGANVSYYNTRNRLLLLSIHHPPMRVWLVVWFQTARTLLSLSIRPKWRKLHAHRDAMWQGVVDFLAGRSGIRPT